MKIKPFLEKKNYHFDKPVAMTTVVFMCEKKNSMVIRAVKISCSRNNINICYSPAGRSVLDLLYVGSLITLNVLIDLTETSIPWKFYDMVNILNYSNSFVNPAVYAIRIPKFQQALCSCRTKRRAAIETEQIERRNRTVALRTPLITLKILRVDPTRL